MIYKVRKIWEKHQGSQNDPFLPTSDGGEGASDQEDNLFELKKLPIINKRQKYDLRSQKNMRKAP